MIYHILNGDALVSRFEETGLAGQIIVMRECLIDGDLKGNTLPEFFRNRANYISEAYGVSRESYFEDVVTQFYELMSAPKGSEFNLWFGYDLFCQANLWFLLSLLHDLPVQKQLYLVYPTYLKKASIWNEYGFANPTDLIHCFNERVWVDQGDLDFACGLWDSYKKRNFQKLKAMSELGSTSFPYLKEVVVAHIDRFSVGANKGRPERILKDIMSDGIFNFESVFGIFSQRAGVYGFGDTQLKKLYDKVIKESKG